MGARELGEEGNETVPFQPEVDVSGICVFVSRLQWKLCVMCLLFLVYMLVQLCSFMIFH